MDPILMSEGGEARPSNRWSGWLKVSRSGLVVESTGLATSLARAGEDLTKGRLSDWWHRLARHGSSIQRLGSVRIYGENDQDGDILSFLVTWASDEEKLAQSLAQASQDKEVLLRFSRALLESSSVPLLCLSAGQALLSSLELTGCLLWIREEGSPDLHLAAVAGVDRAMASALHRLSPDGPPCTAWLSGKQNRRLFLDSLDQSPLCQDVEGRLTRGLGGAVFAAPLMSEGRMMGVLEMIGRRGDCSLHTRLPLLDQMAQMLGLALDRSLAFETAERQAAYDGLTGIPNHRAMQVFLRGRLAECGRNGQNLAVVMIDVDYFRQFNEREGHEAGDQVLRAVAQALARSVRAYDMAARYGGEEFALILPGATRDDAVLAAERVREEVSALSAPGQAPLTVSCGVAVYPDAAEEGQSLLKAADSALYQAKREGRNRVKVYEVEGSSVEHAFDLGTAVLRCLPDSSKEEALRSMKLAGPLAESLVRRLGLRLGHLDVLTGAVAAWPSWSSDSPPSGLMLEVSAGDLRALEPLLRAGTKSLDRAPEPLETAFLELLDGLEDLRHSSRSEDAA